MIKYINCGNISTIYHVEEQLMDYYNNRPPKKSNIGPFFEGYDIGAQRLNHGYQSLDLAKGVTCHKTRILDMPVGIYYPTTNEKKLPCICYLHGGGFTAGGLDAAEHPCKRLAQLSQSCVISFDYGLAPENPFPYAIQQSYQVLKHIIKNANTYCIDHRHVALSGDSAGGNIALAIAQLDSGEDAIISYLMLYYPVLDLRVDAKKLWSFNFYNKDHNHFIDHCTTSLLDCELMFQRCYLQSHNPKDPWVSPILLDTLRGLPPMLICIAEFDYLRVVQEMFYYKFKDTHDIEMICFDGVNHAFLDKLGVFPQADASIQYLAKQWMSRSRGVNKDAK